MVIKKIKPMFTSVITTKDKYGIDDQPKGTIIDPKKISGALKEYQKVVAVGSAVRDVKVGDIVMINPERFARYEPYRAGDGMREKIDGSGRKLLGFEFPTVEIDGVEHLLIEERDITFVVEEWEEDKPDSGIIHPDNSFIV